MARLRRSASDAALERVRGICMVFPGTEEKLSHGAPAFHAKGRHFLMFVDDHHADGRLAVWCKADPEKQRALVAQDPDVYFVPPYVGVKGWVGVRLDRPGTDWIELAMIVEEGWTAIAPPRLARDPSRGPRKVPPPPKRKTTDERVARAALERLTKICLTLPEATIEREGSHASFRVGKKVFAYFLDNHHGDGVVATCFRTSKAESARLVKAVPERFYFPAYMGRWGWVGQRLDAGRVDWKEVGARIEASYVGQAPKKLAARLSAR